MLLGLLCLAAATAAPADYPGPDALPVLSELPDPLRMADGTRVQTREDWEKRRREMADMLAWYEYGSHAPSARQPEDRGGEHDRRA